MGTDGRRHPGERQDGLERSGDARGQLEELAASPRPTGTTADARPAIAAPRAAEVLADHDPVRSPARIAIVRANNIGDFLLAVPAFRALRRAHPSAEITLVGAPKVRDLAARFPHLIDRFAEFPGFPGIRERPFDARATVEFLAWAQAQHFDLALQLHSSGVWSNPFAALLGARFTIGFVRPEDEPLFLGLDASLPYPDEDHEIDRLLAVLGLVGVPPAGRELELPIRPEDADEAAAVLDEAGLGPGAPFLAVHPAGRFPNRTWPAERFSEASRRIAQRHGLAIVVTGGPQDAATSREVARAAGGADVSGRLSLPGLAALYRDADLVLANDTGPAHIAYAVDAPSVTVFGAASPDTFGPLDRSRHAVVEAEDACHPCCGEPCILRVPVSAVVEAADRLLAGMAEGWDGRVPATAEAPDGELGGAPAANEASPTSSPSTARGWGAGE